MYRVQVTGLCLVDSSARQPCKLHPPLWRCRSKTCLKTAYPSGQLFGRIKVISKIKHVNWLVVFVLLVEFCIFSMGLAGGVLALCNPRSQYQLKGIPDMRSSDDPASF